MPKVPTSSVHRAFRAAQCIERLRKAPRAPTGIAYVENWKLLLASLHLGRRGVLFNDTASPREERKVAPDGLYKAAAWTAG